MCIRGTQYDAFAARLSHAIPGLYDKRWGEVYKFCASLDKIVKVLVAVWDETKFHVGRADDHHDDNDGDHGMDGDDDDDSKTFQPAEITKVLGAPMFRGYLSMVLVLNQALEELAAWAERCPCHDALQHKYRQYTPIQALRIEFGSRADSMHGHISCPMRGRRAPEFAAGAVMEMLDSLWEESFTTLVMDCRHLLSHVQWSELMVDFARGKAHCTYIIMTKLHHWQQLPWVLAGLAHVNEDVARRCAATALASFDQTPDNSVVHHRLTMKFCSHASPLRQNLQDFVNGTSRADLHIFYAEVARFFFIPVTERTIEEPHGRIKRSIAFRNHGPLSVSLTARLLEFEKQIAFSSELLVEFAACVKPARSVRCISDLLQLGVHPWIRKLRDTPKSQSSKWVSVLSCTLYRCDEISQFQSFAESGQSDAHAKKRRKQAARVLLDIEKRTLDLALVLSRYATEHMRLQVEDGQVLSLPAIRPDGSRVFESLEQHYHRGSTTRVEHVVHANDPRQMQLDVDDDAAPHFVANDMQDGLDDAPMSTRILFRLVKKNPSRQKVMPSEFAVGRKLQHHHFVVSLIGRDTYADDDHRVSVPLGSVDSCKTAVFSLLSRATDIEWLRDKLWVHQEDTNLQYTMQSIPIDDCEDVQTVHDILDGLVHHTAIPGSCHWFVAPETFHEMLEHLSAHRAVISREVEGGREWQLTHDGMANLRASSDLDLGRSVLKPRDLPLADSTPYEMLCKLKDMGWQWRPLPQKAVDRLQLPAFVLKNIDGGLRAPSDFFTGLTVPTEYLQCLLDQARLAEIGIVEVPHGLTANVYKLMFEGKPYVPRRRALPLLADVGEVMAIVDASQALGHAGDLGEAPDEDIEFLNEHDEYMDLEAALEELLEADLGDFMLHMPPPDAPDPAPPAPPVPPLAEEPLAVAPWEPAVADQIRKAPKAYGVRGRTGEPWGCFWFVFKQNARHGGFQATCPFHRGTDTASQCKKFIAMQSADDKDQCILRAKMWCLSYSRYDRKYAHLGFDPTNEDVDIDADEIERRRVIDRPDWDAVLPDAVLDEIASREQVESAGRGRAQPVALAGQGLLPGSSGLVMYSIVVVCSQSLLCLGGVPRLTVRFVWCFLAHSTADRHVSSD